MGALRLHGFPAGWLGAVRAGVKVHFGRRRVSQRLVRTLLVIAVKPTAQTGCSRCNSSNRRISARFSAVSGRHW